MRTLDDARDLFAYHPATPGPDGTGVRHAAVRDLFLDVLDQLWELVPDGPDKTVMIRELWATQTIANLAIARTAPADYSPTRSVARVLPADVLDDASLRALVARHLERTAETLGRVDPGMDALRDAEALRRGDTPLLLTATDDTRSATPVLPQESA